MILLKTPLSIFHCKLLTTPMSFENYLVSGKQEIVGLLLSAAIVKTLLV